MSQGFLISFEGIEGAGKTVQAKLLRERLLGHGYEVVVVREPGGTVISEQIREVVLSSANIGMAYTTEVLLFQAARAQVYDEIVLPSIKAGKIVLMDRTRDSSVVYQGMVRGFGVEAIEQLNAISTRNLYPDMTFLLDLPVAYGLARRAQTGEMNRLDVEVMSFHQKVRDAYLELARKNDQERWFTVDAVKHIEEVAEEVWNIFHQKLAPSN